MNQHRIIPFYQAFNVPPYLMQGYAPLFMAQDDTSGQDLQYLQEILPEASRRYAKKISDVVDRLDYKGSMIYDEFPDRMRLQQLAQEILRMIEAEEAANPNNDPGANMQPGMQGNLSGMQETMPGMQGNLSGMQENMSGMQTNLQNMQMQPGMNMNGNMMMDRGCREELIFVLLVYEIYKRRHGSSRMDMAPFYGTSF